MKDNHIDILSHSDLFKGISHKEILSFLDRNEYRVESYTKNDVFALAGDKVNYLMIVLEGELIARMVSDSGKYIQIDKIGEGRVVAPAMLFASNNVFPVNVIPESNVFVFLMNKNVFLKAMLQNEILLYNFIQIVSDINHFLSTKIHSLSLKTIKGKLSEYILQQSDLIGGNKTITLTLTKQELADKFAIARPALSRSLSELEEDGLILVKGKSITILDRNKLLGQE